MSASGFFSYVRTVDSQDEGGLTRFREKLEGEIRILVGDDFYLFQDSQVEIAEDWKERLEKELHACSVFVAVVTPQYFVREVCRFELKTFLKKEADLKRGKLVFFVHYVEILQEASESLLLDPLFQEFTRRQRCEWTLLRHSDDKTAQNRKLSELAVSIAKALRRLVAPEAASGQSSAATDAPDTSPSSIKPETESKALSAARIAAEAPPAKTMPPGPKAWTVSPEPGRGDFTSINAALSGASGGDRILVQPGIYRESIVLKKPVEIVGDGGRGTIIVEAENTDVISMATAFGRIARLTIRQKGAGSHCGVNIGQGRLLLEECDITCEGLACVAIHDEAEPLLRHNVIHDSAGPGVMAYARCKAVLVDNEIRGSARAGVQITGNAVVLLRHNRIHSGRDAGVMVEGGKGMLEGNKIYLNANSGVMIQSGGDADLWKNRIYQGKKSGVFVVDGGSGSIDDNDIYANARAGIAVKSGGNPRVTRNRIYGGKQSGVIVADHGRGTFEKNHIYENARSNVVIKTGGNPTLTGNQIFDGKQAGVLVYANGKGELVENEIRGNRFHGIECCNGGSPVARRNDVRRNRYYGIRLHDGGAGFYEDNDLRLNGAGPRRVADHESRVAAEFKNNLEEEPPKAAGSP